MSAAFNIKKNVGLHDWVMYSPHKGNGHWAPAKVVFVGDESIEVIVYAYNGHGSSAVHRGGVRHETDPFWEDVNRVASIIEDQDGGCFVENPDKILLRQLAERVAELEDARGSALSGPGEPTVFPRRKKSKEVSVEPASPPPDNSFREPTADTAPELTAEQKQLRADALKAALASA